jgi:hypothetical protein
MPTSAQKVTGNDKGNIYLGEAQDLIDENLMFETDAPAGSELGGGRFLVVNCPLPVTVNLNLDAPSGRKLNIKDLLNVRPGVFYHGDKLYQDTMPLVGSWVFAYKTHILFYNLATSSVPPSGLWREPNHGQFTNANVMISSTRLC